MRQFNLEHRGDPWDGNFWHCPKSCLAMLRLFRLAFVATQRAIRYRRSSGTNRSHTSNIALEPVSANCWQRGFGEPHLNPHFWIPCQWIPVHATTYSLPLRCESVPVYTVPKCGTELIRYVTFHLLYRLAPSQILRQNHLMIGLKKRFFFFE